MWEGLLESKELNSAKKWIVFWATFTVTELVCTISSPNLAIILLNLDSIKDLSSLNIARHSLAMVGSDILSNKTIPY